MNKKVGFIGSGLNIAAAQPLSSFFFSGIRVKRRFERGFEGG